MKPVFRIWLSGCDRGKFWDAAATACTPCPRGTYNPHNYATSCISCGEGITTSYGGASYRFYCRPCKKLYEISIENLLYLLLLSAASCMFMPYEGHQNCTLCPIGSYNDDEEAPDLRCTSCGRGYTTQQEGSTSSSQCVSSKNLFMFSKESMSWSVLPLDLDTLLNKKEAPVTHSVCQVRICCQKFMKCGVLPVNVNLQLSKKESLAAHSVNQVRICLCSVRNVWTDLYFLWA